jgi:hypothetical protein
MFSQIINNDFFKNNYINYYIITFIILKNFVIDK